MRKLLLLFSLIIGLNLSAHAQGVSVSGTAVVNTTTSVSGIPGNHVLQAVPGAQITVCASTGGGIPCSPLVTIYSNAALTITAANPLTADANGNFSFFVAPNVPGYIYTQTGSGITGQLFTIVPQSAISPGSVTNSQLPNPMILTGTGTPAFFQLLNTSFPGDSATMGFQAPGVFTLYSNNGSGTSQTVIGSNDFTFAPISTGGKLSLGSFGNQWQVTTDTGKLVAYNNAVTAGNGQSAIRASINQTVEVTGNSGTLTLVTPANSNSVYRLTVYTVVSTNVATSTIQWTVSYTDVTGARTSVGTSIAGDTAGTHAGETFNIESQSGVAITLATATANSPKYKYYVRLEEL